jgi:adhesin transport system outer membrane protein
MYNEKCVTLFFISKDSMKKIVKLSTLAGMLAATLLNVASVHALTLEQVVEHTLKTNPELLSSRQQLLSRESEISGAKAGLLPSLDLELGIGREGTESPATGGSDVELTRKESALRLRQLIYDGRATASEVDRQKARYNSQLFDTVATEQQIALRVTEVYINALRQSELLQLLRASLDAHQNIYDQMSLRSDAGVGSRSDLDQIAARLALAKSNYIAGQNNLQDAVSNFYGVVGYLPESSTMERPLPFSLTDKLEASLQIAFANHPQLKSADADIEAAKAQYRAGKSSFYPTLTLEGDRTINEDIDGVEGTNEDWTIALRLRYNLYRGGADVARKNQTAELIGEAQQVRATTKRQVEEGLRLSWSAYSFTSQQIEFLTTYVDSVVATREAYQKQFNIGRRSLLDLLNTENEVLDAKRNYLNADYDRLFARYRVVQAEGTLTNKLGIK